MRILVAVPLCIAVGWCYYRPIYQQRQTLLNAEKALAANQLGESAKMLRDLIALDNQKTRAFFLYTKVLRRMGHHDEAREALARAASLGLPPKEFAREDVLLQAEKNLDQAGPLVRQWLQENPDDVEAMEALAEVYVHNNRDHEAERLYSRLIQLRPDRMEFRVARANFYSSLWRWSEATADLREILGHDPADFEMRVLLANCLLHGAARAEAEVELLKCRQQKPERREPLVPLASCAMDRGDLNEAQMRLNEARRLGPEDTAVLDAQVTLFFMQQRYDLAIPLLEKILQIDPDHLVAHLKLGQALRRKGNIVRAKEHEQKYQMLEQEVQKQVLHKQGYH